MLIRYTVLDPSTMIADVGASALPGAPPGAPPPPQPDMTASKALSPIALHGTLVILILVISLESRWSFVLPPIVAI
jgi:hypothetical protein